MDRNIYAIYDNVAKDIIGGLFMAKHHQLAIRLYSDTAANPEGIIAKHPTDFDLLMVGILDTELNLNSRYEIIMTGKQWQEANANNA